MYTIIIETENAGCFNIHASLSRVQINTEKQIQLTKKIPERALQQMRETSANVDV